MWIEMRLLALLSFICGIIYTSSVKAAVLTDVDVSSGDSVKAATVSGRDFILPSLMFGVGIVGAKTEWFEAKHYVEDKGKYPKNTAFWDGMQYLPLASSVGLNLLGIKSVHSTTDLAIMTGSTFVITAGLVTLLKNTVREMRPDYTTRNSFPSGHSAFAFAGAEILWKEYKDVSPWIGIGGYTVAVCTGFSRIHDKRHWVTDVIGGAGLGILSAKLVYWLYPVLHKRIHVPGNSNRKVKSAEVVLLPIAGGRYGAMSCLISF